MKKNFTIFGVTILLLIGIALADLQGPQVTNNESKDTLDSTGSSAKTESKLESHTEVSAEDTDETTNNQQFDDLAKEGLAEAHFDWHLAKRQYDLAAVTNADAKVPVAIALLKLQLLAKLESIKESPYKFIFYLDENIAANWDLYMITILTLLLGFICTQDVHWKINSNQTKETHSHHQMNAVDQQNNDNVGAVETTPAANNIQAAQSSPLTSANIKTETDSNKDIINVKDVHNNYTNVHITIFNNFNVINICNTVSCFKFYS
ncbi:Protein sel-1 homolog 1 [Eumeta japonica]|uniref:Protein sel-1 homolog 1 n=1 Tax=Eumeta variegata TaxID=151549 RepID=A0A4C2ABL9_EUMVA|nr:Protein sel-1 homolog 1 [Eumeta japonica]